MFVVMRVLRTGMLSLALVAVRALLLIAILWVRICEVTEALRPLRVMIRLLILRLTLTRSL